MLATMDCDCVQGVLHFATAPVANADYPIPVFLLLRMTTTHTIEFYVGYVYK